MKARDIRKPAKGERQPCEICGKHKRIAEQHHILPLDECAEYFNSGVVEKIRIPLIWLCPNCHAYVHLAFKFTGEANVDGLQYLRGEIGDRHWHFMFSNLWERKVKALEEALTGGDSK